MHFDKTCYTFLRNKILHFLFLFSFSSFFRQDVGNPLQLSFIAIFFTICIFLSLSPVPHSVDHSDHAAVLHSTYLHSPVKKKGLHITQNIYSNLIQKKLFVNDSANTVIGLNAKQFSKQGQFSINQVMSRA